MYLLRSKNLTQCWSCMKMLILVLWKCPRGFLNVSCWFLKSFPTVFCKFLQSCLYDSANSKVLEDSDAQNRQIRGIFCEPSLFIAVVGSPLVSLSSPILWSCVSRHRTFKGVFDVSLIFVVYIFGWINRTISNFQNKFWKSFCRHCASNAKFFHGFLGSFLNIYLFSWITLPN